MLTNAKCCTETRYKEYKQQNQQHSKHYNLIGMKQEPTIKIERKACVAEY